MAILGYICRIDLIDLVHFQRSSILLGCKRNRSIHPLIIDTDLFQRILVLLERLRLRFLLHTGRFLLVWYFEDLVKEIN